MFLKLMLAIIFTCEMVINSPTGMGAMNSLALFILLWTLVESGQELRYIIIAVIVIKTVGLALSLSYSSFVSILSSWDFGSYLLWMIIIQHIGLPRSDIPKLDLQDRQSMKKVEQTIEKVTVDGMQNHFIPTELCINSHMMDCAKALIENGYTIYYHEGKQYRFDIHKPTGVIAHIYTQDGLSKIISDQAIKLQRSSIAAVT